MASLDEVTEDFVVMASSLDDFTEETPLLATIEGQDALVTAGVGHGYNRRWKKVRRSEAWQLIPRLLHGRRK